MLRPAQAQAPKYGSRVTGAHNSIIQVYERRTKRIVWTRAYPEIEAAYAGSTDFNGDNVCWSPDHRAIAFAVHKRSGGFFLTFWRAGERVHTIEHSSLSSQDYVEGMIWSPDARSFLVMAGGSGMADVGDGWLFCVDTVRRKVYTLGAAMEVNWVGPRTVKFWKSLVIETHGVPGTVKARKPTYWRIPRPHG